MCFPFGQHPVGLVLEEVFENTLNFDYEGRRALSERLYLAMGIFSSRSIAPLPDE